MDKVTDMTNEDELFLCIGVTIEALCAPSSQYNTDIICTCLESFAELCKSPWSQAKIAYNQDTCVEYVNVLHRTVLTRSHPKIHISALKCVLLLQTSRISNVTDEKRDKLEPGNSFVFGCMEFVMCVLLRKFPELSPTEHGGISSYAKSSDCPTEDHEVIQLAVEVLVNMVTLPTAEFYIEIPESVYLLLTTLFSACAVTDNSLKSVVPQISQGMCTIIKNMADETNERWYHCLTSTIITILDTYGKAGGRGDKESYINTLTVIICTVPIDASNVAIVFEKYTKILVDLFDEGDTEEKIKVLRAMKTLLISTNSAAVRHRYIRQIAPSVLEFFMSLQSNWDPQNKSTSLFTELVSLQRILITNCLDNTHHLFLGFVVPILISLLGMSGVIHTTALSEITYLTKTYPSLVKDIFAAQPHLKFKLETAIRSSGAPQTLAATSQQTVVTNSSVPSIALKMDFSNFK